MKNIFTSTPATLLILLFASFLKAQTISFTASPTSGCAPLLVTFTNTSSGGGIDLSKTYWDFGDGNNYIGQDTSHLYLNGGSMSVYMYAYDSLWNYIGYAYENIDVTGSSNDFYMSVDSACPNETVDFSSYDWTDVTSYTWNFGDGATGAGQSVSHAYSAAGTYTVMLIESFTNGCPDDTITRTLKIKNNIVPTAPFFFPAPNPVCPTDDVMMGFFGTFKSFMWELGDGTKDSLKQNVTHAYTNPGNYNINLIVTNYCNKKDTFTAPLTVDSTLKPTAPFISPYPNPLCPGENVNFSFSGSFKSFVWNFGDGAKDSANSYTQHSYASSGNYNSFLIVTNGCNKKDTSNTATINVYDTLVPAKPDISYWSDTILCPNTQVSLSFSGNYFSFKWDFDDGSMDSTNQSLYHSFSSLGTYKVVLTVWNSCGNSAKDTLTIRVVNTLKPVAPPIYASDTLVCPNDNIYFSFSGNFASFKWDFDDGTTDNSATGLYHSYTTPGTYNVMLEVTNECGKKDTSYMTVVVSNSAPPNVSLYSPYPNPACPNEDVSLAFYGNFASFIWDFGDGASDSINQYVYHQYSAPGSYTITLYVTNNCGISDTLTTYVDINNSIAPNAFFSSSPNPACPGDSISFFPSGNYPGYFWDFFDGTTSTLKYPKHAFSGYGDHPVKLVVTNVCGNKDSITSNVTIDSVVSPVAPGFSHYPDTICPTEMVQLSLFGGNYSSFEWHFGDGTVDSVNKTVNHYYSSAGNYDVFIVARNNCGYIDTSAVQTIVVNNSVKPKVSSYWANPDSVCVNDSVYFGFAGNFASFLWIFGDGTVDSARQNTAHAYSSTGTYNVKLVVWNACGNTDTAYLTAKVVPFAPVNSISFWSYPYDSVCAGDSVQFDFYGSYCKYYFKFSDGAIDSVNRPARHTFSNPGMDTTYLVVENCCGARDTTWLAIKVTNNAKPLAQFSVNDTLFANNATQFTNQSSSFFDVFWDFGNGDTSVDVHPMYSYPATGTFTVTLIITNACSKKDTATHTVTVINGFNISGTVFRGTVTDTVKSGEVLLIEFASTPNPLPTVKTVNINNSGFYLFTDVTPGQYLILANPDSGMYAANTFPTYFGDEVLWENATVLNVSADVTNANIIAETFGPLPGTGTISGKVLEGNFSGKIMTLGDPIKGVNVSLLTRAPVTPLSRIFTDSLGIFRFDSVDCGQYFVFVDIAGIPNDTSLYLNTLANCDTVIDKIIVTVDSAMIGVSIDTSTGVKQVIFDDNIILKAYPNPYSFETNIVYELKSAGEVSIEVYNLLGKKVSTVLSSQKQNAGKHLYRFGSREAGIYIMKLQVDGKQYYLKVVGLE